MRTVKVIWAFIACQIGLWSMAAEGEERSALSVFEQYMKQAQTFADNFPREKAYLHFDNTSYYLGDTIWFKAYVTLDGSHAYSNISRPLYVELVDQAGHIRSKQIVKLKEGEGIGQIPLPKKFLSGYYEIRAYTRWMLSFGAQQYFSRTIPIYQLGKNGFQERHITNYDWSESMEQRPEMTDKKLDVRFFPEGGQLVEGVTSVVAFKAESELEGDVEVTGVLLDKSGKKIADLQTLHDGMGSFLYTPGSEPAVAKIVYKGKTYDFKLPKAISEGYVIKVDNQPGMIAVELLSSAHAPKDSVAVFISHAGRPYAYKVMDTMLPDSRQMLVRSRDLPAGVLQVSLVNRAGHTLCERFIFTLPKSPLKIKPSGLSDVYRPFEPICCELQLKDPQGTPIVGRMSVSILDALHSDIVENDHNMLTDLLFTSDLKGYIHRPGYYLTDITPQKLQELDLVMLIHGWRKYDMEQAMGVIPFLPKQQPESQLVLHGQIKSSILKKDLKDINLTVMIKKEEGLQTGQTLTDENGNFSIPLEDFEGTQEALFQTRRKNKTHNKDASILIDRHFSPTLRPLHFSESHPEWMQIADWTKQVERFDSLYLDSLYRVEREFLLDEVVVKSKRRGKQLTKVNEKSIDAYYDVRQVVDHLRDKGKMVTNIPEFLEMQNDQFYWDKRTDSYTYRQKPMKFVFEGKILSSTEEKMMLSEIDGLESMIICKGGQAITDEILQNSSLSGENAAIDATQEPTNETETAETTTTTSATGTTEKRPDSSNLDEFVFVYLIPLPRYDLMNKNQTAAWGTRKTVLQGYSPVLEFYSPAYPNRQLYVDNDKRRTLYWNPSLQTDAEGKVRIECYNNQYSTPLIIRAEALVEGKIATLTYFTLPVKKEQK